VQGCNPSRMARPRWRQQRGQRTHRHTDPEAQAGLSQARTAVECNTGAGGGSLRAGT
jgi:hypothetical protein